MVKLQKYIAVVCFIFIISSAVLLFADDDRLLISKERWDSLKEWQPDPQGVGEMPNVDFRNFLPSVGNQGFQHSCVGWAIAYACKTYLEVRDQGWQPDLSKRIFSPAFVYNQINRGINRGSNIERALKLLISDGCATLSTMPYRVGNWTSQPSGSARREAGKFRCKSYYPVKSGTLIRKALQQGHVVILSVRTDPVFCSGLFQIYTAREKRRGEAEVARNRRKSYGYHAMCVVGYDDIRRAFLVMNSWSKGWGKEGYCWIAYDVVKDVRRSERNFAQEAWILLDIQQKLDTPVTPPVYIRKQVEVKGYFWYAGYRNKRHIWSWRTSLSCSRETLNNIRRVVWQVPRTGGRIAEYVSTTPRSAFEVVRTATGTGLFRVKAQIYFKDNTQKTQVYQFNFNLPRRRNFKLVQTDRYWGKYKSKPYWEWTLKLKGSLVDLYDVRQVTYHLHPSFSNPNPVIYGNARNGFAFMTHGWGTFRVRATVLFKDGSSLTLAKQLVFNSLARDVLRLQNTARPTGWSRNNQRFYNWAAFITGPLKLLQKVRFVRYYLHPTFKSRVRDVSQGAEYGFPLSTNGWGTFLITADVYFKNNRVQRLTHMLKFSR